MAAKPSPLSPAAIAPALLGWYDRHARTLPWRAPPGAPPADPYRVWLSEIMLQQTGVATVAPRFRRFVERWPDLAALAAADEADVLAEWAGLGYYARARNLIACARRIVDEHGGRFPDDETGLGRLPGVGSYTAAAIAAIAFERRAVVVDANVARVVARLFAIERPMPGGLGEVRAATDAITPARRAGDFAQAMMDLGSEVCLPRAPRCLVCPLAFACRARASGAPEAFPAAKVKPVKPVRHGTVFWLESGNEVLLVRRPPHGLLGGMRALPTGPWLDEAPELAQAPATADWRLLDGGVEHVFTHFRLRLALAVARIAEHGRSDVSLGEWWPTDELGAAGLPTVFARAAAAIGRMA